MDDKLNIVLIEATTRKLRRSITVARLVEEIGKEFNEINTIFVDIDDYMPLPGEGNDPESQDKRWIEINKKSDGYFIVSPEYNHSFPGSLKMLMDNDLGNYFHKPVVIAGVSIGQFGGVRMIENLLSTLRMLGLITTNIDVPFPLVGKTFDGSEEGNKLLEVQKERIRKAFIELIWLSKVLKSGRQGVPFS